MIDLWLFGIFAKFSVILFGGGYMIVPILMQTFVDEKHLLSLEAFGNLISVTQMIPGAISLNAAAYLGFMENGITGALSATFGLIIPTIFLGLIAGKLMDKWKNTTIFKGIMRGARLAALGMVIYACFIFMDMSICTAPVPWEKIGESILAQKWLINNDFRIRPVELAVAVVACFGMLKLKIPLTMLIIYAGICGAVIGKLIPIL